MKAVILGVSSFIVGGIVGFFSNNFITNGKSPALSHPRKRTNNNTTKKKPNKKKTTKKNIPSDTTRVGEKKNHN